MRVLVAPLNWGLGHATRCIPLVRRYLQEGAEVWLGGTGSSLRLLKSYFPELTSIELASLAIRYNAGRSQVTAMLRALPQLVRFVRGNRKKIAELVKTTAFDLIISDNCFGVWSEKCDCVYMTHQLHICLPKHWHWLEGIASKCHAHLYNKYKEVWVPDYAGEPNLSGILGHPKQIDKRVRYIGPLSRFENANGMEVPAVSDTYDVVAVLSGPEPQRTIFEQEIMARYMGKSEQVLIVRGKTDEPQLRISKQNITLVPTINDESLVGLLRAAKKIIARSGYTIIMDLHVLGLMEKAELHPTPGQSEQEYLLKHLNEGNSSC